MIAYSDMSARRDRERGEMRQRITAAARELFVKEGFHRVTIRAIAEAIEYTPGAIYSYFKDKDAILHALHVEGFQELQRYFADTLKTAGTPLDYLRRIGHAYLSFALDHPQMYDLMFVCDEPVESVEQVDGSQWEEGDKTYDHLRAIVRVAMDGGWLRPGDPEAIAFMLWSACHGMVTLEFRGRTHVVPEAAREGISLRAYEYLLESLSLPQSAIKAQIGPRGRG
jgi:AcrR family transcriptional regulator